MKIEFSAKSIPLPRNRKLVAWPVVELAFPLLVGPPLRKRVLIDTGATNSIFPVALSSQLGIADVAQLPSIQLGTGAGVVNGFVTQARMRILAPESPVFGWDWTGEIILANARTSHYGVLGHIGFLEFFDFELRSAENLLSLEENSRFTGSIRG